MTRQKIRFVSGQPWTQTSGTPPTPFAHVRLAEPPRRRRGGRRSGRDRCRPRSVMGPAPYAPVAPGHDARRVPPPRARPRRLDRRLPRGRRAAARSASPVAPGEVPGELPAAPPDGPEPFERRARRPRPGRSSPASRTGSTRASSPTSRPTRPTRRSSASWSRPASACNGHALGHQPGLHRARDADARLDGGAARPARPLPQRRRRAAASSRARRPRPRCAPSWRARERATERPHQPRRRTAGASSPTPPPRRTRPSRRALRIAGHRQRQPPARRRRRRLRHAPDALAAAIAADRAAGLDAVLRRAPPPAPRRRWPSTRCRPSPRSAEREGVWLHVDARHGRHRRPVPRAPLGERRPRAGRLLLHEPAQVDGRQLRLRPVLGGRPRRRCSTRCRSCPSTSAPRPASRRRRSTTATGRSRSAAASGR